MTLVEADVTEGVYDEYRQVMVVPRGMCVQDQAALILELMRERR